MVLSARFRPASDGGRSCAACERRAKTASASRISNGAHSASDVRGLNFGSAASTAHRSCAVSKDTSARNAGVSGMPALGIMCDASDGS